MEVTRIHAKIKNVNRGCSLAVMADAFIQHGSVVCINYTQNLMC